MSFSLKPKHLKRYKDIALLLIKHGRSDVVKHIELEDALKPEALVETTTGESKSDELAQDLEKMGPTFIKLGQLLSTRADFLPPAYIHALTRLQDKIDPFPFEQVEAIISGELGVRISKAFSEFEAKPLATASLGQVHRAAMLDGRVVVVKVQRPGIREIIAEDMEVLEEIAGFLDKHTQWGRRYEFGKMLEEFRRSLWRELDYRQEARNLSTLGANLLEFPGIVVPAPIEDFTTSRVLTMEYIRGKKITELSPLARLDFKGADLAEELFHAYLKQILVDGFFHADPHPGNVFLTDDHRIALLDLGMVGYITPQLQENLLQLLMAVSDGRGNDAAAMAIKISELKEDFSENTFRQRVVGLVSEHQGSKMEQIQVGRVVLEITQISGDNGLRVPAELTMLGKTLLNLDLVGQTLDPKFNPNASIRRNAEKILQQRVWKALSPTNLFGGLLELKDLLVRLPGRLNRILDAIARNELKVKVETIDEDVIIEGLQKVANRIALGLILAALIIGAALLMRVDTSFRIFGYPGFAMLCFLGVGGGGLFIIIGILMHDRPSKK
ncbi:MAG: AarF/UbiB family protein [Verrucomicrobiota bacterium]|jgi:predicted unusual protein kinase regulating ubiquinone biosynthesis (AarF/ABC1/UbiB family)